MLTGGIHYLVGNGELPRARRAALWVNCLRERLFFTKDQVIEGCVEEMHGRMLHGITRLWLKLQSSTSTVMCGCLM